MKHHHCKAAATIVTAATLTTAVRMSRSKKEEDNRTHAGIKQERRSVEQMYCGLGSSHFCHSFWMEYDQFCLLHHKLEATMDKVMLQFYIQKEGRKGVILFIHLYQMVQLPT